ncbi:hypothetical protein KKD04_01075 [Patescibacteria group bacterium]|nr:hypothetical protein [Patescibacteria group bacterium]
MNKGYIALISVLIIQALILAIIIGIFLRSNTETKMVLAEQLSSKSRALAEACAEYALQQLKNDSNYSGNESIIIDGSDSCDILPIETSGSDKIVKTQSAVSGYTRKIKINVIQINPEMFTSYWNEVPNF